MMRLILGVLLIGASSLLFAQGGLNHQIVRSPGDEILGRSPEQIIRYDGHRRGGHGPSLIVSTGKRLVLLGSIVLLTVTDLFRGIAQNESSGCADCTTGFDNCTNTPQSCGNNCSGDAQETCSSACSPDCTGWAPFRP